MAALSLSLIPAFGLILCCVAAFHALASLIAVLSAFWRRDARPSAEVGTPVTVLKPLHGWEPRLYQNLRSFCVQDYPCFQLLFGVREAADPAVAIVEQLQAEFPALDIGLIIDPRLYGQNFKVSNLINLMPHAGHPWLVIADSDIGVQPDYLRRVCAPLAQPDIGVVTCLYRGNALGGLWPRLGCLFIDEWFAPSVRLSNLLGSRSFGFGATLALRRETLDAIGGFRPIADELADDYRLAERVRETGLKTSLSEVVVSTDVTEDSASALLRHELRWMRTIRGVNPVGYTFMVVSFDLPVAAVGTILAAGSALALGLFAGVAAIRTVVHFIAAGGGERSRSQALRYALVTLPLVPLRDGLNLILWGTGFVRRRVAWAGRDLDFDDKGLFCSDMANPTPSDAGHTRRENTPT